MDETANTEFTAKNLAKIAGLAAVETAAAYAGAFVILAAFGYTASKVIEFRERRAAKKTVEN